MHLVVGRGLLALAACLPAALALWQAVHKLLHPPAGPRAPAVSCGLGSFLAAFAQDAWAPGDGRTCRLSIPFPAWADNSATDHSQMSLSTCRHIHIFTRQKLPLKGHS